MPHRATVGWVAAACAFAHQQARRADGADVSAATPARALAGGRLSGGRSEFASSAPLSVGTTSNRSLPAVLAAAGRRWRWGAASAGSSWG